jgi:hypothetical protein
LRKTLISADDTPFTFDLPGVHRTKLTPMDEEKGWRDTALKALEINAVCALIRDCDRGRGFPLLEAELQKCHGNRVKNSSGN